MTDLDLLAHILTAPFRLLRRLFETAVMASSLLLFLFLSPFVAYVTMSHFQHEANEALADSNDRQYVVLDSATGHLMAIPHTTEDAIGHPVHYDPYETEAPEALDYHKSFNQHKGLVPVTWGFWNVVGFYTNHGEWERGKEAPLYTAYYEAATTSDNLRDGLNWARDEEASTWQKHLPAIRLDSPKFAIAWTTTYDDSYLFNFSDANSTDTPHFNEAHDLYEPSATEDQAKAIAQVQYMMTDAYWLHEAHINGIVDEDGTIRWEADQNRQHLAILLANDYSTAHWMVEFELVYVATVLILIARITFASFRGFKRRIAVTGSQV